MNLTLMTDNEILLLIASRAKEVRILNDLRQSDLSQKSWGAFADALPDSWGNRVIENYFLKYKNLSPYEVSPLQKLLYIGNRGVGALEFYPVEGEEHDRVKETLEISELVKESRKVLRGDITELLPELFRVSSDSLGWGAMPLS